MQMALKLWKGTGDVLSWFYTQSLTYEPVIIAGSDVDYTYDVEMGLARQICVSVFSKSIAKVTIEVAQPTVLGVQRRKAATFADQLGVVGTYCIGAWYKDV